MDYMATLEDNAFDLAICDPPYGISAGATKGIGRGKKGEKFRATTYKPKEWDNAATGQEYFKELSRVAEHQIIWGYNYFSTMLPNCTGVVFWDKLIGDNDFSAGELAYTSYTHSLRKVALFNGGNRVSNCSKKAALNARIHPTQKPVKLYEWLLTNYAKPGDRILDTHGGSMSSMIACHYGGFDAVCCELDKDYFEAGKARFNQETKQEALF